MRSSLVCRSVLLLLATLPAANIVTGQSPKRSLGGASQITNLRPPAHPITREQLTEIQNLFHSDDAQRMRIHALLESQRHKLPNWFPLNVWNDAERRVENIDILEISLPIYQKYLSREDTAAVILFYEGKTGALLAQRLSSRMSEALHSANLGASTTSRDEATPAVPDSYALLMGQRLNELTPIEQAECQLALKALRNVIVQINEEVQAAYLIRVSTIAQSVFEAHEKEIDDAQSRAFKNQPSNQ